MRFLSNSVVAVCLGCAALATAASPPSETLFPNTTKGWVSIPNIDLLRGDFKLTQLGKLVEDPVMQPFMEDLGDQLEEKLNDAGVKLGLKFADLDGVYGGEVATGMLKPDPKDKLSHALALTVDITGKEAAAKALLAKIDANLAAKKAIKATKKHGATTIIIYTLPPKAGINAGGTAVYAIEGNTLIASDNEKVLTGILGRLDGKAKDSLGSIEAYKKVAAKIHGEKDPLETHVRWFVDPLGYAEAARAANGGKVKRGADKIRILREQGFMAIQGIGGRIDFKVGEHELLHQSYAYAPADPKAAKGLKYAKAANMLDFPNSKDLEVQEWVPNGVSTYFTFNWELQKAFEHFGSIFDAFTDNDGGWQDVQDGLENDPAGPKINLKAELIAHLGKRVTTIVDYKLPIDPSCERVLVGFELKDKAAEALVKAAIAKLMKSEPDAKAIKIEEYDAWEVADREDMADLPDLDIESPEFVVTEVVDEQAGELVAAAPAIEKEKKINWAITVANGHIFIGTHLGIIADVLKDKKPADQLKHAADLSRVQSALVKLGSGDDSFRFFSRTDKAFHPTFELIKKGMMPQAESILGRTLNQVFAPAKRGDVRKQEIVGDKLPAWEKVVAYFGPAGSFVQSEEEGWLIKGCLLKYEAEDDELKPEEVAGGSKKELE